MAESEQKKMRREFEAWALTRGINIERRSYPGDDFSKYRSVSTELEWIGFKAGWLARGKQEGTMPTQRQLSKVCEELAIQIGAAIKVSGEVREDAIADMIYRDMRGLLQPELPVAPPETGK